MKSRLCHVYCVAFTCLIAACSGGRSLPGAVGNGTLAAGPHGTAAFTIRSTTFKNDKIVPLSMVYKGNGCEGGNRSPELEWRGTPKGTQSFAVLMLDTTAIFWHWGMYGIRSSATSLPVNAGRPPSRYGQEVLNDWAVYFGKANRGYGGPCPPPHATHRYVITLYALDAKLHLPRSAHVENLDLAIRGHVLGSTRITGLYKT